jgi:phosphatidylglycerophosphatase A
VSASAGRPSPDLVASTAHDSRSVAEAARKHRPRFALFVATAGGLGYVPKAPGTFGSLAGLLLVAVPLWTLYLIVLLRDKGIDFVGNFDPVLATHILIGLATASIGVWASARAAQFWGSKDPQRVIIDEVSGQHLSIILGCALPTWWGSSAAAPKNYPIALINLHTALSWKYLLLGLILFRVFDIWKPFPVRQAESLRAGWGIMADDWVAGLYAAIGLWIARAAGL